MKSKGLEGCFPFVSCQSLEDSSLSLSLSSRGVVKSPCLCRSENHLLGLSPSFGGASSSLSVEEDEDEDEEEEDESEPSSQGNVG